MTIVEWFGKKLGKKYVRLVERIVLEFSNNLILIRPYVEKFVARLSFRFSDNFALRTLLWLNGNFGLCVPVVPLESLRSNITKKIKASKGYSLNEFAMHK